MSNSNNSSRVACITGANKGIGKGIAERLCSQGMTVVVAARTRVEETVAELGETGGRAVGYTMDITDEQSVVELFERRAIVSAVSRETHLPV